MKLIMYNFIKIYAVNAYMCHELCFEATIEY